MTVRPKDAELENDDVLEDDEPLGVIDDGDETEEEYLEAEEQEEEELEDDDEDFEESEELEEDEDEEEEPEEEEEEGEVEVGFKDEEDFDEKEAEKALGDPGKKLLKKIRKANESNVKQILKLKEKLAEANSRLSEVDVVKEVKKPVEPTMEDEDVDYDPDKFVAKFKKYNEDMVKYNQGEAKKQEKIQEENSKLQTSVKKYTEEAISLGVKDFAAAEKHVQASLTIDQQRRILKHSSKPAALVLALSKSPDRLEHLSTLTDSGDLALYISTLDKGLTVNKPKKKAPKPATRLKSSPGGAPTKTTLDRLEAKGSSDRTKIVAHKLKKRKKEQGY